MSDPREQPTIAEVLARARSALTEPGAYFELADEDVRGVTMPVFRNRSRSLRDVLDASARFGDRTFVVDGDVHLDFATHLELVEGLAAVLQSRYDVQRGDRVALYAANRWEWIVAFWAIVSAGAVPAPFNGWWTPDEFAHACRLVDPVLVICDEARAERATEAGTGHPLLDLDRVGGLAASTPDSEYVRPLVAEDDVAVLLFTSGTTGRPKAVATTHRGVVGFAQVGAFGEIMVRVAMGASAPRAGDDLPASDETILVTSPLFHTSMLYGVVLRALCSGMTVVLLPGRFDPQRVYEAIERERITTWSPLGNAAPRVCAFEGRDRYDTSSLRRVGVGGAPVSAAVQDQLRETFPSLSNSLGIGYASTESVALVANIGGPELAAHPTSTGRIMVTTSVELRDEHGDLVADGELGEIHVRSPYIMRGYWDDPDASAAVLKPDGWLAMGDLGRMVDGLLYIDSRARDLILVNAENVSPTEVEHRLEAHADVREAAVFAVDDELTGDAVCAVVVTDPGSRPSPDELATWCGAALAYYKVPTRWHFVHEHLPRTASGKLVKDEIRALAGE